jgi:hypothetical protein|uniref:Glycosyltransferase 2-like domain-containing protein n=1 Tax=viral metagenome TaxID=1070528 RepID=A0A6C0CZJ7_9ZZZZ
MNKRKLLEISLILTLISFVYIICDYFGLVRYTILHCTKTESYIKNYRELAKNSKNRVVLSFTSKPVNIQYLEPLLNSILDQTVKVDKITLNLSTDNGSYIIPERYKDVLNIYNVGKGYGKWNHLLPTLQREGEADTIIIYFNDNIVLGKDCIETILEESSKNPDKVIVSEGVVLVKPKFFDGNIIDCNNKVYDNEWINNHLLVNVKKIYYNENYLSTKIK